MSFNAQTEIIFLRENSWGISLTSNWIMTVHFSFGYLQGNMNNYACSRLIAHHVCLGMFRSLNGWYFKLWFLFLVLFPNGSFKLSFWDPCYSCIFGPPKPRLRSFPVAVDKPHPPHSMFHFTKGWPAWIFGQPQVSINSLFLQRVSMIQPLGTLCKRTGFCWPCSNAGATRNMEMYDDKWRLHSLVHVQNPISLIATNRFVHLKQRTYLSNHSIAMFLSTTVQGQICGSDLRQLYFALVCFGCSLNAKSRIITTKIQEGAITLF